MPFGETIVALATPVGESAIATIRLSGPASEAIACSAFRRSSLQPRHAYLGRYRDLSGTMLDQCLFLFFADQASYTGEPTLEITLHGNPLIAQKIVEDLIGRGCRMAEPGEFTRTAFMNGKLDLAQAEAVSDLIKARSEKALHTAHQQLSGAVGRKISDFSERLLQVIAAVEAYIDFPEEDLPPEDSNGPAQQLKQLIQEMQALAETSHYSTLLHEGIKTVIIGAPNAGKSSLLNALTGDERAIVSDIPGTTRDFISERILIGPYCIQITDTAGIHTTESAIEQLGIEKTLQKIEEADCYLLVADAAGPLPILPDAALNHLRANNTLVIENKTDLPAARPLNDLLPSCPHVRVSLRTGAGMEDFRQTLQNTLETDRIVPTEDALIVSARHATALKKAIGHLETARTAMLDQIAAELMASDLRGALDALGEIVGKIDNEEMLDKLFASFCIGK